jgi:hypothetical protein
MRVNFRNFTANFYLGNFIKFSTLKTYLTWAKAHAPKGPFAFIFAQENIELTHTVAHHIKLGFRQTVMLANSPFARPEDLPAEVALIPRAAKSCSDISQEMNAVIAALPQRWIYFGYNGEYLFYPFCETRSIGEIIAFNTEERRKTISTTVVNFYAWHLGQSPHGVDVISIYLDRLGYYAETRRDGEQAPLPQQFNFYGGLRWRFEEHVP